MNRSDMIRWIRESPTWREITRTMDAPQSGMLLHSLASDVARQFGAENRRLSAPAAPSERKHPVARSRVMLALSGRRLSSADLARVTGLPRPAVEEALRGLGASGMARREGTLWALTGAAAALAGGVPEDPEIVLPDPENVRRSS